MPEFSESMSPTLRKAIGVVGMLAGAVALGIVLRPVRLWLTDAIRAWFGW